MQVHCFVNETVEVHNVDVVKLISSDGRSEAGISRHH